jgi:regulator of sigma E protease
VTEALDFIVSILANVLPVIYAVLAFGILIFCHELGHFLMAKAMNVRVLTFALGFGTKLIKFQWGGTEYAICAVPLGGYVKMIGEDPEDDVAPEDLARSFSTQSVAKRFIIVVAGPAFNLFLALLIVWVFYLGEFRYLTARIQDVLEGSPAAEAGMRSGDRILAIDGESVRRWQDVLEKVMNSDGALMRISLERDGSVVELRVTPRAKTVMSRYGDEIRLWQIGVTSAGEEATDRYGPGAAMVEAGRWTWDKSVFTVRTLVRLIQGKESVKNIGSPLLIGVEAGKQAQQGAASYFSFIAFISVILAIMNLLPIPVLDGGHLFFFAVEAVVRRPVNKRIRGVAQYVGIGILACIMGWAIYRDLDRFYYWKVKQPSVESPAQEAPPAPSTAPEKP